LEGIWNDFSGNNDLPYPFMFSAQERKQIEADVERVERGMEAMSSIKDRLGELLPEQRIVRSEQYDEELDALIQMREQVIDLSATDS